MDMRNTETNPSHLAIANRLFNLRSTHTERALTKVLCWSKAIDPSLKSKVRQAALTLIETGAAFLATGNPIMGAVAMERYEFVSRFSKPLARLADALATLFAASFQMDRRQGIVSYRYIQAKVAWMADSRKYGDVIGYVKAVCRNIRPLDRAIEVRVVRAA